MAYRRRYSYTRHHRRRHRYRKQGSYSNRKKASTAPIRVVLGIVVLLAGASVATQFAKQHPAQASGLGILALIPLAFFAWRKIQARSRRKNEEEQRRLAYLEKLKAEERAALAITQSDIDNMTGEEFELHLAKVFGYLGFEVKHTGRHGDQGADLLLTRNGSRIACQCKRYKTSVGNAAVQQALAAKLYYECEKSLVVTNNIFTKEAHELARRSGCELIDRRRLGMIVAAYREDRLNRREHLIRMFGLPSDPKVQR